MTLYRPESAPIGGLSSALAPCLIFASRPVARRSASQLGHALPEALAGLSVGRLSDLLFRQRERLRYRSQLCVARGGFTWVQSHHGTQQKSSASPSKPIAPEMGEWCEPNLGVPAPQSRPGTASPRRAAMDPAHPPAVKPSSPTANRIASGAPRLAQRIELPSACTVVSRGVSSASASEVSAWPNSIG